MENEFNNTSFCLSKPLLDGICTNWNAFLFIQNEDKRLKPFDNFTLEISL